MCLSSLGGMTSLFGPSEDQDLWVLHCSPLFSYDGQLVIQLFMRVNCCYYITAEALVSGHPRSATKVSVTGAGRLRECENTEFVREFNKTGFD